MLQPTLRLALVISSVAILALAALFGRRQARAGVTGGAISRPKLAWLAFAVLLWFLVVPLIALDPGVQPAPRLLLGVFAAGMWARGLAELFMLYVTRSWRPPYGVAHDVACLVWLVGGLLFWPENRAVGAGPLDPWVLLLLVLLVASLVVETLYATLFFRAVRGKTTGEDGVWFASDEEARFARINRLTAVLNLPLYATLAFFFWGVLRPGG
jgi:hypothetical protein